MQFRTPLEDFPLEKWRELMRVNVESAFIVGKAVVRNMISRKRGKIINVASVQSELGRPSIAPYTASKGAIKMLTKGMCADWAKHNIQVNAIGPGYFKTPLNKALVENAEFSAWLEKRTPAGRWGEVRANSLVPQFSLLHRHPRSSTVTFYTSMAIMSVL